MHHEPKRQICMPSNKNAFTRYKVLDELLSNSYHNYTIDDLVEKVNERLAELSIEPVGIRCIQKDLDYLKGMYSPFFAEIETFSIDIFNGEKNIRRKCYRYKDPSFSIFKKELSSEEKYLLSQALSVLGQFDGLPNLKELEKLRNSFSEKSIRQVISITKNPLEKSTIFGELFSAITQSQVVKLDYHLFNDGDTSRNIFFHPYLLKEYNRRWYLLGAAEEDNKTLCFGLDQIIKVTPQPSHRYLPYKGQLDDWFDDIIGISKYEENPVQRIYFWVSDNSDLYVKTKPLHESQIRYSGAKEKELRKQYPQFNLGSFFSIDCRENYELIRELTSFGEELIVLSPSNIQDKVIKRINAMHRIYSSMRT